MKKLWLAGLVLAAVALGQGPKRGGELRATLQAEPKTLDPLMAAEEPSEMVRYLTSGRLLRLNRVTQEMEPELATSWKVTDGGRRIEFVLRSGVVYSDGTPFVGGDVCHTFRKALDPKAETAVMDSFQVPAAEVACEAAGQKVSLRFPKVMAGLERLMDVVPVLSEKGAAGAGLGPFVVTGRQAGVSITLGRNAKYWKRDKWGTQLPYLDGIVFEIQRNRELELRRFRAGELDVVNNLNAELYERLKAEVPAAVRELGVSLDTEQLWFNQVAAAPIAAQKRAWFRTREFRVGVSLALKRAEMVKVVYQGHAAPAIGPVPAANRFWHNAKVQAPAGDVAAALAMLGKAGFQKKDGVLRDAAGQAVEFSIITNAGNKSRERLAAMIQQDLAALGIRVTVTPLDFPSLIDRIMKSFDYDACLLGLVGAELDPNSLMNVWMSSSAQHGWNPNQKSPETAWEQEMDRLMEAQAAEPDGKRRKALYDRVQEIVVEQAPFIYLVHPNAMVGLGARVRGWEPSVLRPQTLWNAERLSMGGAR